MSNYMIYPYNNASSPRNLHENLNIQRKGGSNLKTNALGDVRNTLHSRSRINNSSVKKNDPINTPLKKNENISTVKNTDMGKILDVNAKFQKLKLPSNKKAVDIHNHSLCELAEESYSNFPEDNKIEQDVINDLIKFIKPFRMENALNNWPFPPCNDIVINERNFDDFEEYNLSDISNCIVLPSVSDIDIMQID